MKKVFILCGVLACSLSTMFGMENMESLLKGIEEAQEEQRQPNQLALTRRVTSLKF